MSAYASLPMWQKYSQNHHLHMITMLMWDDSRIWAHNHNITQAESSIRFRKVKYSSKAISYCEKHRKKEPRVLTISMAALIPPPPSSRTCCPSGNQWRRTKWCLPGQPQWSTYILRCSCSRSWSPSWKSHHWNSGRFLRTCPPLKNQHRNTTHDLNLI